MPLKFTAGQLKAMEQVLDSDYESVAEAAKAALATAVGLIEDRAKFMVIGQLSSAAPGQEFPPDDGYEHRMVLGWFSTAADAQAAARSLTYNSATHEAFRVAILPVFHGTAAGYYQERKKARDEKATARKGYFQRELQRRLDWLALNPGGELPEDMRGVIPMVQPKEAA